MRVFIVAGDSAEDQRSLYAWLTAEEDLRGRVRLEAAPPPSGALGSWPGAVTALLAPGVVTALAGAVTAWLRHRTADVRCVFTRADGTRLELSARRVQQADLAGVQAVVGELAAQLTAPERPPGGSARQDPDGTAGPAALPGGE